MAKSALKRQSLQSFLEYYWSKVTPFEDFETLISSKHKFDIVFVGSSDVGPGKFMRSSLAYPICKIYLIAKFGTVFSVTRIDGSGCVDVHADQ